MNHGQGRRKPPHNYSRGGEVPSGSSYRPPPAGRQDAYYSPEYLYRPEGNPYSNATSSYPVSEYTHAEQWSYEQERFDYDARPWRREVQEDRRGSPVYEDYPGSREDASASGYANHRSDEWRDYQRQYYAPPYPYSQTESQYNAHSTHAQGDYDRYYRDYAPSNGGYSEAAYHDTRHDRDYEGYAGYRPPPSRGMEYPPPTYHRSASPPAPPAQSRGYASQVRAPIKLFQSPPILRPASPPKPLKRTKPTESYLAISSQPSPHILNPSDARKLIVLDLNGSLVLRSAHSRRVPPLRHADLYADPSQLRPLRTVHRRPYLASFTSYLLHAETKKWLDTMVWSSAQPHSVADMVEHCFGDRKSELKAVWARDTLGLAADDYHKKSQTLKDLEKPWEKLHLAEAKKSEAETSTTTTDATPTKSPSSHSALTTLLVDDSPAKAALQPWNHLVIRDYVQAMRNMDLLVADWETRRPSKPSSALKIEQPPAPLPAKLQTEPTTPTQTASITFETTQPIHKITREVVMVNGELTNSKEEIVSRITREVVMIEGQMVNPDESAAAVTSEATDPTTFVPNQKRKAKRLAKKESVRLAREEKEREAFMSLKGQLQGSAALLQMAEEQAAEATEAEAVAEPEMRYDETLLAVIGVLDHVKHEGNVAGWMRRGGLLHTSLAQLPDTLASSTVPEPAAGKKHEAPSRNQSPSQNESPAKKIKLSKSDEEVPPSSSPPTAEEQASTGVPLSSPVPAKTAAHIATHAGLWYENPAVLQFWADRGRGALKELGIKVESGMVAIPGAVQNAKI